MHPALQSISHRPWPLPSGPWVMAQRWHHLLFAHWPIAPVRLRERGAIEHWLSERYCLYTVHQGRIYRGEIHHQPWPLQDASAEIMTNTMAAAADIQLPDTRPLLHFARRLDVMIWP